jgi:hypothetical protein
MRNIKLLSIILGCLFVFMAPLKAQVKSGTTSLDKSSVKGLFGGAFVLENGNIALFYQHKDGISAYEFNADSQFEKALQASDANSLLDKTMQSATTKRRLI